eukprot:c11217_g1_i1 orf=2-232(-)
MQLRELDRRESDFSSPQGLADCQNFNVEHIFFTTPPDCTGILQLSNNSIDVQKQIDGSQTSGSCYCCMQGYSSIARF